MHNSSLKCEAEHEFRMRYYRWALKDAEREVLQEFPFVSQIKDQTAKKFLLVMESLSLEQQISYAKILVRHSFQDELKNIDERLSTTELNQWKEFSLKEKKAQKILYEQGLLNDVDTKVNFKTLRTLIEAEIPQTIGTLFKSDGNHSFAYRKSIGFWNIDTHFFLGGRAKLNYMHVITPMVETTLRIEPLVVSDVMIWLGIGRIGWNLLTDKDAPVAAECLATICMHFMNEIPELLVNLSHNLTASKV